MKLTYVAITSLMLFYAKAQEEFSAEIFAPINCVGSWQNVSSCTTTCGCGVQIREYKVTTKAEHGGTPCDITNGEKKGFPCTNPPCPPGDCEYHPWSLGKCSAECGEGEVVRTKTLKAGPDSCEETVEEPVACQDLPPCPIHCAVSEWTEWSECSAKCDKGKQTRTRAVETKPQHGGDACPSLSESQECMDKDCPVVTTNWPNTDAKGEPLNATFLEGFGILNEAAPNCRDGSVGECAKKCEEIEECEGFVFSGSLCCFFKNITEDMHLPNSEGKTVVVPKKSCDSSSSFSDIATWMLGGIGLVIALYYVNSMSFLSCQKSGEKENTATVNEYTPRRRADLPSAPATALRRRAQM